MPPIEDTVTAVSFAAYATQSDCQVDVGTVDAGGAFTTAATVTLAAGQWERYATTVQLTVGNEVRVALRLRHSASSQQSVWIDDLEAAACGVGNVASYGERATGATLQWTATDDGATVDVQLRRTGSSSVQTLTDAESPLVLEGFESVSEYAYYLRTNCEGVDGCCMYGGTFTTNAGALTADYCHGTILNIGTSTWTLPYLEEESYTGLLLSLETQQVSGSGSLQMGLMTDDGDAQTFTLLATFDATSGSWNRHSTTLDGHESDGHYIALRTTGGTIQVKNLRISHGSLASSGVEGVSATTATLSWTTEGVVDSVRIYIDGVIDTLVAAESGSYVQSDLAASTNYQYTLTSISATSTQSCTVDDGTFTTLDADIEDGYCFGFDGVSYGNLPTGWSQLGGGSMTGVYYAYNSARLRLAASSNNPLLLVLPATTAILDGLKMRFDAECGDNSGESLIIVGRMTDGTDASTFTPTDTVRPKSERRTYALDLGSNGVGNIVALRYESNSYYAYIDNLGFADQQVGEVSVSEVTSHSVRVSWTQTGPNPWPVTVSWSGETGSGNTTLTGTSVVIDSLEPNTEYEITVRPFAEMEDTPCRSITITTHTLVAPMMLPLCVLLEDYNSDTQLPYGWTRPYGSYPVSQTSTRIEGQRALRFYTGYGSTMMCSPMMEVSTLEGQYLSLMLMNT